VRLAAFARLAVFVRLAASGCWRLVWVLAAGRLLGATGMPGDQLRARMVTAAAAAARPASCQRVRRSARMRRASRTVPAG